MMKIRIKLVAVFAGFTALPYVLFFSLVFFPDHTAGALPPSLVEKMIITAFGVVAFPVCFLIERQQEPFRLFWGLFAVGAFLSAIVWTLLIIILRATVVRLIKRKTMAEPDAPSYGSETRRT